MKKQQASAPPGPTAAAVIQGPVPSNNASDGAWAVKPGSVKQGCCRVFVNRQHGFQHQMQQENDDDDDVGGTAAINMVCSMCAQVSPYDKPLLGPKPCTCTSAESTGQEATKRSMPPMPPNPSQPSREKQPPPATRKTIVQVLRDIDDGEIQAPACKTNGTRTVLADNGSAPNAASHAKHLPGSQPVARQQACNEFVMATDQPVWSNGRMAVNAESMDGFRCLRTVDGAGLITCNAITHGGNHAYPDMRRDIVQDALRGILLGNEIRFGHRRSAEAGT